MIIIQELAQKKLFLFLHIFGCKNRNICDFNHVETNVIDAVKNRI